MSVRAKYALRKVAYDWNDFGRQAVYGGVGAGTGALVNYLLGNKSLTSYLIGGGLGALGGIGLERWNNSIDSARKEAEAAQLKADKAKRDQATKELEARIAAAKRDREAAEQAAREAAAARERKQKEVQLRADAEKGVKADRVTQLEKKRKAEGKTVSDAERQALQSSNGTPTTDAAMTMLGLSGGSAIEAGRSGIVALRNRGKLPNTEAFNGMFGNNAAGKQMTKSVLVKEVTNFVGANPGDRAVKAWQKAALDVAVAQPGTVAYMEAKDRLTKAKQLLDERVAGTVRPYGNNKLVTAVQRWAHTPTPRPAQGAGFVPNAKAWGTRTGKFAVRNAKHGIIPAATSVLSLLLNHNLTSPEARKAQSLINEMQR